MHALQVLVEQRMYLGTGEVVEFDLHEGVRFLLQPNIEPRAKFTLVKPAA